MKKKNLMASLLAALLLVSWLAASVSAASESAVNAAVSRAVSYTYGQFQSKGAAAVDDWALIGLTLAGESLFSGKWGGKERWQKELERRLKGLDARKTTDYARFTLTVTAAGFDPANIGNVNLIDKLKRAQLANGKFADSISGQGQELVNAHVWSIIALYAAGEQIPRAKLAKDWLVARQLPDGGFQFSRDSRRSGVDMTAMTLLAFRALGMSKNEQPVQKALAFLKRSQTDNGGFKEEGAVNAESAANVISALIAWGEKPDTWRKAGGSAADNLLTFQLSDGSFRHTNQKTGNKIATAQALLALVDLKRGNSYLFTLREKAGAAKVSRLQDLPSSHWAYKEVSYLVKNGYMQGVTSTLIQPDKGVTRAQFAALLLRAIGEEPGTQARGVFRDVSRADWSASVVEKAAALGLMQGSQGMFRPHQSITHEEMAVISSRVAGRYGWKKTFGASRVEVDWSKVSAWAKPSVQDLQKRNLLGGTRTRKFEPKSAVTRAEAAVMLYRLLHTR